MEFALQQVRLITSDTSDEMKELSTPSSGLKTVDLIGRIQLLAKVREN